MRLRRAGSGSNRDDEATRREVRSRRAGSGHAERSGSQSWRRWPRVPADWQGGKGAPSARPRPLASHSNMRRGTCRPQGCAESDPAPWKLRRQRSRNGRDRVPRANPMLHAPRALRARHKREAPAFPKERPRTTRPKGQWRRETRMDGARSLIPGTLRPFARAGQRDLTKICAGLLSPFYSGSLTSKTLYSVADPSWA